MLAIVWIFSVFIIGLGSYGLIRPAGLVRFGRAFQAGPGIWGGFALRAALALALWFSAPAAATPDAFRVLAILSALGALALPAMGTERFARLVEAGARMKPATLRAVSALALAFGSFLLWSAAAG